MSRVLAVARDADLRDAIEMALKESGNEITCVESAEAAVALVCAREFDAVIVESVPPQMTTFQPVRDAAAERGVPWIAIVSGAAPPGAAAVLKLPFASEELAQALREALR